MKDVSWGDVIFSLIIASVVIGSISGIVWYIFSDRFGLNDYYGVSIFWLAALVASLAGSLILARIYPGPDKVLDYAWAWALAFAIFPVLGAVGVLLGNASTDAAVEIVSWGLAYMSMLLFVVLLATVMHTRSSMKTYEDIQRMDL